MHVYREDLTIHGKVLLDRGDLKIAKAHKWSHVNGRVQTRVRVAKDEWITIMLAHLIIGRPPEGKEIDYINLNTFDCRAENLRFATRSENCGQRSMMNTNTSGYKGVSKSSKNRWRAMIMKDYKMTYLGQFENPEQAARAYDQAALELHGEFALTNEMMGLI
jgi:hypothetical protein